VGSGRRSVHEDLRRAEARHREALAAFLHADGDRLLGLNVSQ